MSIKRPYISNPELAHFNELVNITDAFAKLSNTPLIPLKNKLKVFV